VFIPLKTEKLNVHNKHLSIKLYVDADLRVVKKSNDESLQVSRFHSSTHVWCIDAPGLQSSEAAEVVDSDRCSSNTTMSR
jgi:hypothetical protein